MIAQLSARTIGQHQEKVRNVLAAAAALGASIALTAASVWWGWLPLAALAGAGLMLIALLFPFLIAVSLPVAVSLSPELPLGLPVRVEDLIMFGGVAVLALRLMAGQTSWRRILNWQAWLALLATELTATLIGGMQGTTRLDLTTYSGTMFLAKSAETFLLYTVVVWLLDSPAKIKAYAWVFLVSGASLGAYGMIAHLRAGTPYAPVVDIEGGPTYSLMGLALLTPLMLGVALWLRGEGQVRWVVALLLLPMVYSLVFSLSRQTYIGAAAMLCLVLLVYRPRLLLLAIPLFFLLLPYVIPDVVVERVSWLDDPFTNAEVGLGVYSTRVNAWRYRLPEMLQVNPITGRGLASLPPGFLDSQYLINLYYTGFVGLAAFLWLLASFARQSWRLYRSAVCPFGQALGLAGVGAVVGLGIAGLGGAPFVAVRAREMFWLLMAGVSAYSIQLGTASYEEKPLNQP